MHENNKKFPILFSRLSKYLIERGKVISVDLMSTNYRLSPLVHGGLEKPYSVRKIQEDLSGKKGRT